MSPTALCIANALCLLQQGIYTKPTESRPERSPIDNRDISETCTGGRPPMRRPGPVISIHCKGPNRAREALRTDCGREAGRRLEFYVQNVGERRGRSRSSVNSPQPRLAWRPLTPLPGTSISLSIPRLSISSSPCSPLTPLPGTRQSRRRPAGPLA